MKTSVIRWAVGLAAGTAVGVGLCTWLLAGSLVQQQREQRERFAVIRLQALVQLVTEMQVAGGSVQEAVMQWQEAHPEVAQVRVVEGRELAGSTAPADTGEQAAPRRLSRDEKDLFDLAQRLRSSVQTNREDQVARKDEIEISRTAAGTLSLAAPLETTTDGGESDVTGAVLLELRPQERPRAGLSLLPAVLAVVLPVAVLLLLGLTPLAQRRAAMIGLGALLLLAAVGFYARTIFAAYQHQVEASAEEVASEVVAEYQRTSGVLAQLPPPAPQASAAEGAAEAEEGAGAEAAPGSGAAPRVVLDPSTWDADVYRHPRGLISASGQLDREQLSHLLASASGRWNRNQLAVLLVALLVASFFGLGGIQWLVRTVSDNRQSYYYVAPAMLGMLVLVFFPFFYGIALSFTNQNIYNTDQSLVDIWVGFDNYVDIITDFNVFKQVDGERVINFQNFWWTLFITVVWTVSNVTIGVTLGLILALLLNTKGLAFKAGYRVLLILPWAMPNYITALIWKGMFHSQFGVINQVIQVFGGEPVSWFDSVFSSFITVLTTNGWLSFPFMMVISLGALQSIPADLYEAARVDGASRWQQFKSITLPMLQPALVPAVILSVIWTFNMFNIIFLVSEGQPSGGTEILITAAYKIAFEQYRYGYAAAYSTVIFGILLIYGTWQIRVTKATEGI